MPNHLIANALLCLTIGITASPSLADERQDIIDQIIVTGPLTCTDGALHLFNEQLMRSAPLYFLDGIKGRAGFKAEWGPGNENFERARAVVVKALNEEIARRGPFIDVRSESLMRTAFATKSIEEIRYLGQFFASPAGKVYWESMIEGTQCANWLKSLDTSPFLPFTPEQKVHVQQLQSISGGESRFTAQFNALSKADKSNFDNGYKKLGNNTFDQAMIKLGTQAAEAIRSRAALAVSPYMPEIMQIIQEYRNQN